MDLNAFIERGRPRWSRLSELLDRIERLGLKSLELDEAQEFGRLYRAASSDLLWARHRAASAELVEYLNDLVGRGYAQTYPGQRPRLRDFTGFFARGFPRLLRRHWRAFAVSYALFLGGGALGFVGMALEPTAAVYLVPEMHQSIDPDERVKQEATEKTAGGQEQTAFTSFLFTHNIRVAFLAFALGLTLGMGTALVLFANGLFLGALAQLYHAKGHAIWFWAWILPHGVPEITAICISGAAGLLLGQALLAPGDRLRGEALRQDGRTAVRIVLGTIPLFIVAGIIEGTLSQIHEPQIPSAVKLLCAMVVAVLLALYLGRAGAKAEPEASSST